MDILEIETRRVQARVSQVELCRLADIDPSTYTKLRQQPQRQPRPRTLRKLLAALNRAENGAAASDEPGPAGKDGTA